MRKLSRRGKKLWKEFKNSDLGEMYLADLGEMYLAALEVLKEELDNNLSISGIPEGFTKADIINELVSTVLGATNG